MTARASTMNPSFSVPARGALLILASFERSTASGGDVRRSSRALATPFVPTLACGTGRIGGFIVSPPPLLRGPNNAVRGEFFSSSFVPDKAEICAHYDAYCVGFSCGFSFYSRSLVRVSFDFLL